MEKQEFLQFCHKEFTQREFKKKKNVYYRKGNGLLCGLHIQKSMAEGYYVNYYFFIGEYDDPKLYPTRYDFDLYSRIGIPAVDDYGVQYQGAFIEYELYTADDLKPHFEEAFKKFILPPLTEGTAYFLMNPDLYFTKVIMRQKAENLRVKLNLSQEVYNHYFGRLR